MKLTLTLTGRDGDKFASCQVEVDADWQPSKVADGSDFFPLELVRAQISDGRSLLTQNIIASEIYRNHA